jgi:hypothetical protein
VWRFFLDSSALPLERGLDQPVAQGDFDAVEVEEAGLVSRWLPVLYSPLLCIFYYYAVRVQTSKGGAGWPGGSFGCDVCCERDHVLRGRVWSTCAPWMDDEEQKMRLLTLIYVCFYACLPHLSLILPCQTR